MINHALSWLDRGFAVFPLRPRDKVPIGSLAPHGVKDASKDPAVVRAWWRQVPKANIGLATGNGFFVLDLDGSGAEDWFANACGRHGEPDETLEIRTARGRHIYFWAPCAIPNSASRLGPKVDIRGDGGYVVAPPSAHPDGSTYLIIRDVPIAGAPRWLIDLALPEERPPPPPSGSLSVNTKARGVAGIVSLVANASEGERNALVFWAGCRFAEMVAEGVLGQVYAEDLLFRAASSAGLPEKEIAATIRSALGRSR